MRYCVETIIEFGIVCVIGVNVHNYTTIMEEMDGLRFTEYIMMAV